MRGHLARGRRRLAIVTGLTTLVAASGPWLPAAPAIAAPACVTPPPAGAEISATPWPQLRYAPDRLAGLADGTGITVAVIDSGVDAGHAQLRGRVLVGQDPLGGGDGRVDCVGHGTAVASIIAGQPQQGIGFRGFAPRATILPVRVSEQDTIAGSGRTIGAPAFGAAIRYAVDRGARVLNLSVVLYVDEPAVRDAIRYAVAKDVVVVAAAGNAHSQGDPTPYPAGYEGVIGVGAIGPDGQRWQGSPVGEYVDLVAPGQAVTAAAAGGGYAEYEGTSFAVPFVTAAAALVRQYLPSLSAPEVATRLLGTADPSTGGRDSPGSGHGVLNPYRAGTERVDARAQHPVAAAVPAHRPDAEAAATARRTRNQALAMAGTGAVVALVVVLAASAVPRGRRRGWRVERP
jgi:membrane-anchored mycosin MYCP